MEQHWTKIEGTHLVRLKQLFVNNAVLHRENWKAIYELEMVETIAMAYLENEEQVKHCPIGNCQNWATNIYHTV